MKLFSRKSTDQKKRAQARNAMKKLKKGIVAEMEELNKEMESVKAEYEELFGEIQKVVALMDKEIEDAKAEGLDTSEMEKKRSDLAEAMEEVKQAVKACPTSPFAIPASI